MAKKKSSLFRADWFIALLIGLLFTAVNFSGIALFDGLEQSLYDAGVRGTSRDLSTTEKVSIIAIDEKSLERIGRWPWPRNYHAEMVNLLTEAKAKTIGMGIFFFEPQVDQGIRYIENLEKIYSGSGIAKTNPAFADSFEQALMEAYVALDTDSALVESIASAKNVLLPWMFQLGRPIGNPDKPLPEIITKNRVDGVLIDPEFGQAVQAEGALLPLDAYIQNADAIGHFNILPDADGGVRTDGLLIDYYGEYYPSMALMLAARSLNLGVQDISFDPEQGLSLGQLKIVTDSNLRMYSGFYKGEQDQPAFTSYSFADVLSGEIPKEIFAGQIVLIGPTAAGIGNNVATPVSANMAPVELFANFMTSILNEDFYTRPSWTLMAELGLFALITFYLMFGVNRLSAVPGAVTSLVLLLLLLGSGYFMITNQEVWLKTAAPTVLLIVGHLFFTTRGFFATERTSLAGEIAAHEDNKQLGLSYQSQGQLDMALDKFRKLTMDDAVADLLYNLALDFERKRQFGKSASVFDLILKYDKKYRDVAERKDRASNLEGTLVLGAGGASAGGTLILDPKNKPTLGRYEVEKELGKGAMGIVYMGRDPKINRVVAIKTMALSHEFEGDELKAAKDQFFREAETAGILSHPNIVTIYDAGEDQELAYIAMEFVEGGTLEPFVKPASLMPPYSVLVVVSKIAEALQYAHEHNVVHRDIKPANIMMLHGKTVKVADFGIARITESSKTKTGVVMGTPSYMSPEQLAGKHVDGRSDLFSLGVMTFELLTGTRPFKGDSMATLMFNISQNPHQKLKELRPDLPASVGAIIDKALAKNADERYQNGNEMIADIVRAAQEIKVTQTNA